MTLPGATVNSPQKPVTWPAFGLIFFALVALLGGLLDIPILQSFWPNLLPATISDSISFLVCGVALYCCCIQTPSVRRTGEWLAIGLLAYSVLRLGDAVFHWDSAALRSPGRTTTAFRGLGLVALGVGALGLIGASRKKHFVSTFSVLALGALSLLGLSGYAFYILGIADANILPLSIPGTLVFSFLAIGLVCAGPDSVFCSVLTSSKASGRFLRVLGPVVILMPLFFGLATRAAQFRGWIQPSEMLSINCTLVGVGLATVAWFTTKTVREHEVESDLLNVALADKVARLRLLHAVTSDPSTTFGEKVESILNQVRATLGVDLAAMLTLGDRGLVVKYLSPSTNVDLGPFTQSPSNPFVQQVFLRDGPIALDASTEDVSDLMPKFGDSPIRALLAQKIVVDAASIGLLLFASTKEREKPFSPDDLDQLRLTTRWIEFELNAESASRSIKSSEERFKNLADATPGAVFQFVRNKNNSFAFLYMSEGSRQLYGLSPDEIMRDGGSVTRMAVGAHSYIEINRAVDYSEKTLTRYYAERRYRLASGDQRWIETFADPRPLENGTVVWTGVALDVTEKKEIERRLQRAQDRLTGILSSVEDVIFSLTADGSQTTFVSDAATHLLGLPPSAFLGDSQHFTQGVHKEDRARVEGAMREVSHGKSLDAEIRYFREDGKMLWLRTRARLVVDEEGKPIRIDGISTDITRRKSSELAVLEARAEAEKANAAKSDFLSRMSHELRTPMNAILGFAQLLELGNLTPKQGESVDQILKAGRHLLHLVNEVLDISRIESGVLALSLEPVELCRAVREAIEMVRPLAEARRIDIVHTLRRPGLHVIADSQRLRQVFLNLFSNAIKYSPLGSEVEVNEGLEGDWASVHVIDHGAGLSSAQIDRLFTPFDRLGADTSGIEGTGLGLSLANKLATAMGGKLNVQSTGHSGSTFTVTLRVSTSCSGAPNKDELGSETVLTRQGSESEILLIEDNLSNVRLIEEIVQTMQGTALISATRGQLGLDLALRKPPTVVLLDVNLPDVSGLEMLEQIRTEKTLAGVPVIILSADATDRQVSAAMEAGATAYITKPFNVREFIRVLRKYLPGSSNNV